MRPKTHMELEPEPDAAVDMKRRKNEAMMQYFGVLRGRRGQRFVWLLDEQHLYERLGRWMLEMRPLGPIE